MSTKLILLIVEPCLSTRGGGAQIFSTSNVASFLFSGGKCGFLEREPATGGDCGQRVIGVWMLGEGKKEGYPITEMCQRTVADVSR